MIILRIVISKHSEQKQIKSDYHTAKTNYQRNINYLVKSFNQ